MSTRHVGATLSGPLIAFELIVAATRHLTLTSRVHRAEA